MTYTEGEQNRPQEPAVPIEQLQEMSDNLETQGYDRARLQASLASAEGRKETINKFGEMYPSLNGQKEQVLEDISTLQQESAKKETFLGKVWEGTKETGRILAKPVVWGWEFAKKHPYITTGVVLTAAGLAAWYTGIIPASISAWVASAADAAAGGHVGEVGPAITPSNPIVVPPGQSPIGLPPMNPEIYPYIEPPILP